MERGRRTDRYPVYATTKIKLGSEREQEYRQCPLAPRPERGGPGGRQRLLEAVARPLEQVEGASVRALWAHGQQARDEAVEAGVSSGTAVNASNESNRRCLPAPCVAMMRGSRARAPRPPSLPLLVMLVFGAACLSSGCDLGGGMSSPPCRQQPECRNEGRCATSFRRAGDRGVRCYAASAPDCASSEVCRAEGRCALGGDGTCVRPEDVVDSRRVCEQSPGCTLQGWCSPVEGSCEAGSNTDCQGSVACATVGRCQATNGACLAGSNTDCTGSLECRAFGRCALTPPTYVRAGGDCVRGGEAARPDYCLGTSSRCLEEGRCLRSPSNVCQTPDEAGIAHPLPEALAALQRARSVEELPSGPDPVPVPAPRPQTTAPPNVNTIWDPVTVECSGSILHGLAPRAWVRDPSPAACGARWTVPSRGPAGAWMVVHCLPAQQRVTLSQLDSWYRMFRQRDGSLLPDVGTGHAALGSVCGMREITIRARATLVEPIACVPIVPPAEDTAFRRTVLEASAATFVFDLVGAPDEVERWGFGEGGLVESMRSTAPTSPSASPSPYFDRPCP